MPPSRLPAGTNLQPIFSQRASMTVIYASQPSSALYCTFDSEAVLRTGIRSRGAFERSVILRMNRLVLFGKLRLTYDRSLPEAERNPLLELASLQKDRESAPSNVNLRHTPPCLFSSRFQRSIETTRHVVVVVIIGKRLSIHYHRPTRHLPIEVFASLYRNSLGLDANRRGKLSWVFSHQSTIPSPLRQHALPQPFPTFHRRKHRN